jgi:5-hydroxyisourate hydrolase-like protein (transthyretin family)
MNTHHLPRQRPRRLVGALALAIGLAAPLLLSGCAGPAPADYASQSPKLDLKQYFNGKLLAHGIVTDRSGKVMQRFTVQLTGTWQGDTGTLDERFTYSDGRQETRVWTLQRGADGRYTGRAADVVGDAQGQAAGNALNWRYTLRVPVDGRSWDVEFDDWMFLVDEHVMINRAVMSKFGIRLGEVLLSFQRLPG